MRIDDDLKLTFGDVLIRPKRSTLKSRSEVSLSRIFKFRHTKREWKGIPVVAANMDTTGTFEIANELQKDRLLTCLQKFYSVKDIKKAIQDGMDPYHIAITSGSTEESMELLRRKMAIHEKLQYICLDVANGYREDFLQFVRKVRKEFDDKIIIAGNVATREMTEALILAGADIVKVGIGPGSVCTTRKVAGVGYPQLSAIMEVRKALVDTDIPLIADGGIRFTGDIPKAIAAGADSVMLGSMLAGTRESPGETIIYEGRKYKTYRGMGSVEAMKMGSKDRYFQDVEDDIKKLVPEGIVGRVPFKGDLNESIHQFVGGLRAGMGYCGAKNITMLKANGKFITITSAGMKESHPHDISITKEAPNYSPS